MLVTVCLSTLSDSSTMSSTHPKGTWLHIEDGIIKQKSFVKKESLVKQMVDGNFIKCYYVNETMCSGNLFRVMVQVLQL